MRFRAGDENGGDPVMGNRDGFGVGTSEEIHNFIFDHCSATWALDENAWNTAIGLDLDGLIAVTVQRRQSQWQQEQQQYESRINYLHDDKPRAPFLNRLVQMDLFVAESLADDEEIAFNAGSHTELIELAYEDFERLVEPEVMRFSLGSVVCHALTPIARTRRVGSTSRGGRLPCRAPACGRRRSPAQRS